MLHPGHCWTFRYLPWTPRAPGESWSPHIGKTASYEDKTLTPHSSRLQRTVPLPATSPRVETFRCVFVPSFTLPYPFTPRFSTSRTVVIPDFSSETRDWAVQTAHHGQPTESQQATGGELSFLTFIFGRFWFLDNFDFWTIFIFGGYWFLDNIDC